MTLFLTVSFLLGPLANVWGDSRLGALTAEQALLNAIRERVSFSLQANLARAKTLQSCFLPNNNIATQVCNDLIHFMRETTAFEYPRMRQYQFMINLLGSSNFRTLQADFIDQLDNLGKKTVEQSPFLMGLQDDPLEDIITRNLARKKDIPNTPFSAVEIQSFLRNDIGYSFKVARLKDSEGNPIKYPMNFDGHLQMMCDYVLFEQHADGCRSLHLAYNANTEKFNFIVDKSMSVPAKTMSLKLSALDLGIYQLAAERDDLTRRYFALIQLYPFVALAPSAVLSNADMKKMADVIVNSAQSALDEFLEFLLKTQARPGNDGPSGASREEWLQLLAYSPIVEDVLSHPSEEMTILRDSDDKLNFREIVYGKKDDKSNGLNGEHLKDVAYRQGERFVGLIAANILVCGLPWERGIAFAVKAVKIGEAFVEAGRLSKGLKSAKLLCFPVTSAAINFGYSWVDVVNYENTYDEVFGFFQKQSSPDVEADNRTHFLREVSDLDSERRAILYSFIMTAAMTKGPVADMFSGATKLGFMGAWDGIKWLSQRGIRLSQSSLRYLAGAVGRVRSQPVVPPPPTE